MSLWTYLSGVIRTEPIGRTREEMRYVLDTTLNHLPLVTGSERDMEIHVSEMKHYGGSSSCDEYGETTNNLIDFCGYHNRRNGWLRTPAGFLVTIEGNFRDRVLEETHREFVKWLVRLAKRIPLDGILVRINDRLGKEIVINDNCLCDSPWYQLWERPSWCDEDDKEENWCEHLLWWTNRD